jgi:hypothetical protein
LISAAVAFAAALVYLFVVREVSPQRTPETTGAHAPSIR